METLFLVTVQNTKGLGIWQLTGRVNYEMLANYTNDDRVMEGGDYVAKTYPFTSAGAWWSNNSMSDLIDGGAKYRGKSHDVLTEVTTV